MRDVFLCLSGQSCVDFEHLVIGHRLTSETESLVEGLIVENPGWLRQRITFLKIDHGNRTAPLNAAIAKATGRYFAILDDDDLVFAHWVETFRTLAEAHDGAVLRSVAVYQKFTRSETELGEPASRADGDIIRLYPPDFDLFSHLQENRTPLLALAFPRNACETLGLEFDETLTTGEDWDYLIRAAARLNVASSPEITAIYRHWNNRGASRTEHSDLEWVENLQRIKNKHDRLPFLLPEGSAKQLREILDERDQLARAVRLMVSGKPSLLYTSKIQVAVATANRVLDRNSSEQLEALRLELKVLYASIWWKLSAPVRWIAAFARGAQFQQPEPYDLPEAHLRMAINSVTNSTSWKITGPLRSLWLHLRARR